MATPKPGSEARDDLYFTLEFRYRMSESAQYAKVPKNLLKLNMHVIPAINSKKKGDKFTVVA